MDTAVLAQVVPTKVIDARGTACPGPLLEAKKGIGTVKAGQIIEVKSNDVGSRKDIAAIDAPSKVFRPDTTRPVPGFHHDCETNRGQNDRIPYKSTVFGLSDPLVKIFIRNFPMLR